MGPPAQGLRADGKGNDQVKAVKKAVSTRGTDENEQRSRSGSGIAGDRLIEHGSAPKEVLTWIAGYGEAFAAPTVGVGIAASASLTPDRHRVLTMHAQVGLNRCRLGAEYAGQENFGQLFTSIEALPVRKF